MRKRLDKVVREHLEEPGRITGYLLITFRDGQPLMTGQASDADEVAQTMIEGVMEAIDAPLSGADDEGDPIGICWGTA